MEIQFNGKKNNKSVNQVHENILQFLLERHKQDENFKFILRKNNTRQRLEKGYWFEGNEDYLEVSFWTGTDWKSNTANISFCINFRSYDGILKFNSKDSDKKLPFFEKLSKAVPGVKQLVKKDKTVHCWGKYCF